MIRRLNVTVSNAFIKVSLVVLGAARQVRRVMMERLPALIGGLLQSAVAPLDLSDYAFLGGLALLAAGLAFVYWPAALIVPGALLVLVALIGMLRPAPAAPPAEEEEE